MRAPVFNISRASLHDGRGIRTVVYFKGCPLSCLWCHNPEGIAAAPEILFCESRCINCGRCVSVCPEHHGIISGGVVFNREGCAACGDCADVCPPEAISLCGSYMTPGEVFQEISADAAYYKETRGGATFSGGECLLYPEFLVSVMEKCRAAGINTAVETALCVPRESVERVLSLTDAFIVDIKHHNGEKHRALTGRENGLILENIAFLSRSHRDITIRIPLIPGQNDDDENLVRTAQLINSLQGAISAVELLKYNNLAKSKYDALGKPFADFSPPQSDGELARAAQIFRAALKLGTALIY